MCRSGVLEGYSVDIHIPAVGGARRLRLTPPRVPAPVPPMCDDHGSLVMQITVQCTVAVLLGTWGVLGLKGNFVPIRTTEHLAKQYALSTSSNPLCWRGYPFHQPHLQIKWHCFSYLPPTQDNRRPRSRARFHPFQYAGAALRVRALLKWGNHGKFPMLDHGG